MPAVPRAALPPCVAQFGDGVFLVLPDIRHRGDFGRCGRAGQVRAQGRQVESEVEELRQVVSRLEAEKARLAEKVEEEGAERVTIVAAISHERDFLLRQARSMLGRSPVG